MSLKQVLLAIGNACTFKGNGRENKRKCIMLFASHAQASAQLLRPCLCHSFIPIIIIMIMIMEMKTTAHIHMLHAPITAQNVLFHFCYARFSGIHKLS